MNIGLISTLLLMAAAVMGVGGVPRAMTRRQTHSNSNNAPTQLTPTLESPDPEASSEPPVTQAVGVEEEAVTEEVRRVGVNGWLAAPTQAPARDHTQTEAPRKDKPGLCESPKGYGIKCMSRVDQCKHDQQCPGSTKCCMVGECGHLCVKPKPTSDDAKTPVKESGKKNIKEKEDVKEEGEEAVDVVPQHQGTRGRSIASSDEIAEHEPEISRSLEENGTLGGAAHGED